MKVRVSCYLRVPVEHGQFAYELLTTPPWMTDSDVVPAVDDILVTEFSVIGQVVARQWASPLLISDPPHVDLVLVRTYGVFRNDRDDGDPDGEQDEEPTP